MVNQITIVGRLTRTPEAPRTGQSGTEFVNFTVAVNKRIPPRNSEESDADFFDVVAFGKTATYVADRLEKGRLVAVTGRIESRKYTNREGAKVTAWEIKADNVQSLERPRDAEGGSTGGGSYRDRDEAPAASAAPAPAPDYADRRPAPAARPTPPPPAADEYDPFGDD